MKAKGTLQAPVSSASAYRAVISRIPADTVVQARPNYCGLGVKISGRLVDGFKTPAKWTRSTMTIHLTVLGWRWLAFWVEKFLSI
jgi:hypothetical protein